MVFQSLYINKKVKTIHVVSIGKKKNTKIGRAYEADMRVPDISVSWVHAEITYKNKYILGSSVRYNDFMKNIDKVFTDEWLNQELIPGINEAREKFKNGDIVFDLRLGYQMDKNSKLSLIVNNLFNREYMSRPADMQPQRTIAVQLSLKI